MFNFDSAATLKMKAWQAKLQEESQIADVMVDLAGTYNGKKKTLPNNVIMDVSKDAKKGVSSVTVPILMDLSDSGTEGRDSLLGNEEDQAVKHVTLYAHNVRHGVPTEAYGLDAWEKEGYNLVGQVQGQLSKWHNAKEGFYMREAICEKYASNLTKAPVSKTQEINSNVYFVSATTSKVTFDTTLADFVTAIDAAAPTTPTAANQLSIAALNDISSIASVDEAIVPIEEGNKDMYILLVPSNQAKLLRDSTDSTQLANLFAGSDKRGNENKAINGELGIYHNLILVEDPRAPKVTVNTTVVFSYRGPGSTDNRAANGTTVFDVCMLLGRGALGKLMLERLHFKEEVQDYESVVGVGAIATYGYQLIEFDEDTETDTSRLNQSSILFLAASATA
jgi:hypothetical protein